MNRSQMLPNDAHNRTLLDNVHPLGWTNPTPDGVYNIVIIGGGTAGLITAAVAASMGARTALIERGFLGGDCLNVGCVHPRR
jgi:NADPH-dependent 2,4-dienoyl-CoA reductase/sulfur reductase-like enzyme